MTPSWKKPRKALERLSPHHHDASHGQRLEVLEVGGDVPGQCPVAADHVVSGAGDDNRDRRPVHPDCFDVRGDACQAPLS